MASLEYPGLMKVINYYALYARYSMWNSSIVRGPGLRLKDPRFKHQYDK